MLHTHMKTRHLHWHMGFAKAVKQNMEGGKRTAMLWRHCIGLKAVTSCTSKTGGAGGGGAWAALHLGGIGPETHT